MKITARELVAFGVGILVGESLLFVYVWTLLERSS